MFVITDVNVLYSQQGIPGFFAIWWLWIIFDGINQILHICQFLNTPLVQKRHLWLRFTALWGFLSQVKYCSNQEQQNYNYYHFGLYWLSDRHFSRFNCKPVACSINVCFLQNKIVCSNLLCSNSSCDSWTWFVWFVELKQLISFQLYLHMLFVLFEICDSIVLLHIHKSKYYIWPCKHSLHWKSTRWEIYH